MALLVREREHAVSEVAKFLGRDHTDISMMLLRALGENAINPREGYA